MDDGMNDARRTEPAPEKLSLSVAFDTRVVDVLQQACATEADFGPYLEHLILHRLRAWQRSIRALEETGWTRDEVGAAHASLANELFLDSFEPTEVAAALGCSGLRRLSRRVSRSDTMATALLSVVVELSAGNASCVRAVSLMRSRRRPWWRRL